jgi:hypothetical protein
MKMTIGQRSSFRIKFSSLALPCFGSKQALGDSTSFGKSHVGQALRHIWTKEGTRGLYKGISLNLIKNPLATGVSFLVNDWVKEVKGGCILL